MKNICSVCREENGEKKTDNVYAGGYMCEACTLVLEEQEMVDVKMKISILDGVENKIEK